METDRYQAVDAEGGWSSPSTTILGLERFGNGRVGLKVESLPSTWESSSELPPIAEFCEPSVSVSLVSSSDEPEEPDSSESGSEFIEWELERLRQYWMSRPVCFLRHGKHST